MDCHVVQCRMLATVFLQSNDANLFQMNILLLWYSVNRLEMNGRVVIVIVLSISQPKYKKNQVGNGQQIMEKHTTIAGHVTFSYFVGYQLFVCLYVTVSK